MRIIMIAVGVALAALTFAGGILPFNYKDRTLTNSVVQDMDRIGAKTPEVDEAYTNAFGTSQWRGNLEDTGEKKIVRKDEKFSNSGLLWNNGKREKLQGSTCSSIAKANVQLCLVLCKPTGVTQWIKRDCLNIAGRKQLPKMPRTKQVCEEVAKPEQAGAIGVDIDIDVSANASAIVDNNITTSASTGPMTLNFFQPYASSPSPYLYWGGQTQTTYNSLIGWGWQQQQRPTSIKIDNVNSNVNNIANTNVNANNQVQNMVNGNGSSGSAGGSAAGSGNSNAGGGSGGRGGRSP